VISRKRKIVLVQLTIFFIAAFLLYDTYRDKNGTYKEVEKIEIEVDPNNNNFIDIQYSGFDLSGNRYTLNAGEANFKTDQPEAINMKNIVASFYLKNGTILKIVSDEGFYNNITLDMKFRKNVKSSYLTDFIFSDQLDYSNANGKLLATGNVRGESVEKGQFSADNVEYDIASKTLDFSMFGGKQVNIKIKN
jgi:hypothetical protein|tara:strand:- start:300 stop:875 length:576 start_codon:yes stop_codon:yes gene_type:complete